MLFVSLEVFYDQVHSTGVDIRHPAHACAALTLGKDSTFRDFAQGAYRLRGISKGQRLEVLLTPEVHARVEVVTAGDPQVGPLLLIYSSVSTCILSLFPMLRVVHATQQGELVGQRLCLAAGGLANACARRKPIMDRNVTH